MFRDWLIKAENTGIRDGFRVLSSHTEKNIIQEVIKRNTMAGNAITILLLMLSFVSICILLCIGYYLGVKQEKRLSETEEGEKTHPLSNQESIEQPVEAEDLDNFDWNNRDDK